MKKTTTHAMLRAIIILPISILALIGADALHEYQIALTWRLNPAQMPAINFDIPAAIIAMLALCLMYWSFTRSIEAVLPK
jgi:hypothetical protein